MIVLPTLFVLSLSNSCPEKYNLWTSPVGLSFSPRQRLSNPTHVTRRSSNRSPVRKRPCSSVNPVTCRWNNRFPFPSTLASGNFAGNEVPCGIEESRNVPSPAYNYPSVWVCRNMYAYKVYRSVLVFLDAGLFVLCLAPQACSPAPISPPFFPPVSSACILSSWLPSSPPPSFFLFVLHSSSLSSFHQNPGLIFLLIVFGSSPFPSIVVDAHPNTPTNTSNHFRAPQRFLLLYFSISAAFILSLSCFSRSIALTDWLDAS